MSIAAALLAVMNAADPAAAQQPGKGFHVGSPVWAFTYDMERARSATSGCGCFWLKGAGTNVGVPLYKGLGVAGNFGGGHAGNIQPGVSLGKVSYLAGPRYTLDGSRVPGLGAAGNRLQIFGEALFGGTYAFDGTFPAAGGTKSKATSFATQFGGGLDVAFHGGLGVRVLEVDYVRTSLPNNSTNSQSDLRLAFGISYRFRH
jgi:hypothetical protein